MPNHSPAKMAMKMAHLAQVAEAIREMFPDGRPEDDYRAMLSYDKLMKKFLQAREKCRIPEQLNKSTPTEWTEYRTVLMDALVPVDPDIRGAVRDELARNHVAMAKNNLHIQPEEEHLHDVWQEQRTQISQTAYENIRKMLPPHAQHAYENFFDPQGFLTSAWTVQTDPDRESELEEA